MKQITHLSNYRAKQTRRHRVKQQRRKFRLHLKDYFYIILILVIFSQTAKDATQQIVKNPVTPLAKADIVSPLASNNGLLPTPTDVPQNFRDQRIKKLFTFFREKGSPLADYAQLFVEEADKYGLDYTLMPAISCKESSCAEAMPDSSFNPFGLGGTHFMYFNSFPEVIEYEAKLLSNDYRLEANGAISYKYCPPSECSDDWATFVTDTQFEIINK